MTINSLKWESPWLNPVFEPYDSVVRVANALVYKFINGNRGSVQIDVRKLGCLAPAVVSQAMLSLTKTYPSQTEAFVRLLVRPADTKTALAFHQLHEMDLNDD